MQNELLQYISEDLEPLAKQYRKRSEYKRYKKLSSRYKAIAYGLELAIKRIKFYDAGLDLNE